MRKRLADLGRGPLPLFGLAGALGVTSVLLAVGGWQSSRRFEDQLDRAARVQAELLARDFTEEVRALSAAADDKVFGTIRFQARWTEGTAAFVRESVREATACGCVRVIPEEGGAFVWRSSEPDRLEVVGIAPAQADTLLARVRFLTTSARGIGSDVILLKGRLGGREVAAPMLRVVRGDVRMAAGYIGTPRGQADSVLAPAARAVQSHRFGDAAADLVAWRVVSPAGQVVMREGEFTERGAGVSVAFLRPRFSTDTAGSGTHAFIGFRRSPSLPEGQTDLVDLQQDPAMHPVRLHVQVDPTALGNVLYGTARGPLLPIVVLVTISILLTVATLALARRIVRNARERETFATAVAHDLRTPLTQILLYGESLQLDRPAVRTQKQAARVIVREARRLIHLVENALHFVRGGRARPTLALETLRLAPLVEEIVGGLQPVLDRAGVTVRTLVATDAEVRGDRDAINRVLTNLLDNAVRFGPPGQTVTVTLREDGAEAVRLEVIDQGPGIPAAQVDEVVKPFVTGGQSPGAGIGLAVSKQLIELMDGTLRIDAAPGGGARVAVLLPRAVISTTPLGTTEAIA
jgi:signal transduction histidine kinase